MELVARSTAFLCVFLGFSFLIGCGKTETKAFQVSGTVSLDGKPLPEGFMYFKTIATGEFERIDIKDGAFKGNAQPGLRRVEIISNQPKKVVIDGKTVEVPNNIIHPSFNLDSKLTAKVTAEGPNEFTFQVKKK